VIKRTANGGEGSRRQLGIRQREEGQNRTGTGKTTRTVQEATPDLGQHKEGDNKKQKCRTNKKKGVEGYCFIQKSADSPWKPIKVVEKKHMQQPEGEGLKGPQGKRGATHR